MKYKQKSYLLTIFFILIIQIFLYINNTQKSSFRYFIWNIQEVSVGRLISISFFSGLLISTLLNKSINFKFKENFLKDEDIKDIDNANNVNEEYINNDFEIPPQRDIRDTQPTISVNYRVIKNSKENNLKYDNNSSTIPEYQDDWNDEEKEW